MTIVELMQLIAAGDRARVLAQLEADPSLAKATVAAGATRQQSKEWFLDPIAHYMMAGDTALHIAAAAYDVSLVKELLKKGAAPAASNRRRAQPLHYAMSGGPQCERWSPDAQPPVIVALLNAGADPNALNADGVAPLHIAVRNRCPSAVEALLDGGASLRLPNGSGSTALHLAVIQTGRGGTGSDVCRVAQAAVIDLLLSRGASLDDEDRAGRPVRDIIRAPWLRERHRLP